MSILHLTSVPDLIISLGFIIHSALLFLLMVSCFILIVCTMFMLTCFYTGGVCCSYFSNKIKVSCNNVLEGFFLKAKLA